MLPRRGDAVVIGEFFEELDVGDEPGAREEPLEQVVRQKGAFGNASLQGSRKRVDVVDPFSGEDPFAEEVLVDVGDREGVRIDAPRPRKNALEEGASADRRKHRRDPRLQDSVAIDDAARDLVEDGPVQGMRHSADELVHRASRQPRVAVERDDVSDALGRRSRARKKRRIVGAPEQAVELLELSPLALPSHPSVFRRAPQTATMEQQESVAPIRSRTVSTIELLDT